MPHISTADATVAFFLLSDATAEEASGRQHMSAKVNSAFFHSRFKAAHFGGVPGVLTKSDGAYLKANTDSMALTPIKLVAQMRTDARCSNKLKSDMFWSSMCAQPGGEELLDSSVDFMVAEHILKLKPGGGLIDLCGRDALVTFDTHILSRIKQRYPELHAVIISRKLRVAEQVHPGMLQTNQIKCLPPLELLKYARVQCEVARLAGAVADPQRLFYQMDMANGACLDCNDIYNAAGLNQLRRATQRLIASDQAGAARGGAASGVAR